MFWNKIGTKFDLVSGTFESVFMTYNYVGYKITFAASSG